MEPRELARILRNWQYECDGTALYEGLARIERSPQLQRIFRKLAASERGHAAYWERQMAASGHEVPASRPSWRVRLLLGLARHLGIGFVAPRIARREVVEQARYSAQSDASAAGLSQEERGHAAVMRRVASYGSGTEEQGAGHGSGALSNNLRAAILGANDGLASNFCLMMGVAGGGASSKTIILTGVAGLVAGACSMALGEWLSVTNAHEMLKSQIDIDNSASDATVPWTHEQAMLMLEATGVSEDEARRLAEEITNCVSGSTPTLRAQEHMLSVALDVNNPTSAAAHSFIFFAAGACIPLLPFLVASATRSILASAALSAAALFGIGALTSFFNGRRVAFSGVRQVGIGVAAAAITYGVGLGVGSALG